MSDLFRQEAIEAKKEHWLGRTVLPRSISLTAAVLFTAPILLSIAMFMSLGEYTRRVRLAGLATPSTGIIRIVSPRTGKVSAIFVGDGQKITTNQKLLTISMDNTSTYGATQAALAEKLRDQREKLEEEIRLLKFTDKIEKQGLIKESQAIERELEQVRLQIETSKRQFSVLKDAYEKYRRLADTHVIIEKEVFDRLQNSMQKETEIGNLGHELIILEKNAQAINDRLSEFDARSETAISALRRQVIDVDKSLIASAETGAIEIRAPENGTVTAIVSHLGQTVTPDNPLMAIVPEKADLEVHLFGTSNAIGFIQKDRLVMLRYSAFPYQKFGLYPGKVIEVGSVALRPRDVEDMAFPQKANPTAAGEAVGVYRIKVKPLDDHITALGRTEPIIPGMAVEADIFLERRPIYQWILDPIYSLKGTLEKDRGRQ